MIYAGADPPDISFPDFGSGGGSRGGFDGSSGNDSSGQENSEDGSSGNDSSGQENSEDGSSDGDGEGGNSDGDGSEDSSYLNDNNRNLFVSKPEKIKKYYRKPINDSFYNFKLISPVLQDQSHDNNNPSHKITHVADDASSILSLTEKLQAEQDNARKAEQDKFANVYNDPYYYHQLILAALKNQPADAKDRTPKPTWCVTIEGKYSQQDLKFVMPYLVKAAKPHVETIDDHTDENVAIDIDKAIAAAR